MNDDQLDSGKKSARSENIDLNDNVLIVDISDALSEKEKVKFTVHTKVSVPVTKVITLIT